MGKWSKYSKTFQKRWNTDPLFSNWLQEVPNDGNKGYCVLCKTELRAHKSDLKKHRESSKHKQNCQSFPQLKLDKVFSNVDWMKAVSSDVDNFKTKKYLKIANSYGDTEACFPADLNDHVDITDTENFESSCTVNEEEVSSEEYATPEKKKKIIIINANEIRVPERSFKASNFFKSSVTPPPLEEDNDVIFGKFLINELKSLKNEEIKSKLKRKLLNMVWNADEGKVDAILSKPFPVFVSSEKPIPLVKSQFANK